MEFYNTEVGKILAHGVHENNSSAGQILGLSRIIREESRTKELSQEDLEKYLTMMETAVKKSQDGMDYVYSHIKALEEKRS